MSDNKTNINCEKTIYRKFLKALKTLTFWVRDFFVFSIEGEFK